MGTFSKIILSGSTDGQGIDVTGTTPSAGTVIHTAVTGAADSIDEIYVYAFANVTTAVEVGLHWGATASGSRLVYTITGDDLGGLHLISPGLVLRNAKVVKAYVTAVGLAAVFGYVNRFAT